MYFNSMYLGLKTTFAMSMDTKSSFLEQIMGNNPEIIHFET